MLLRAHEKAPLKSGGVLGTANVKLILGQLNAKLDEIGFEWAPPNGTPWDEKFEELRRFHDAHGRWPKTGEGALGRWVDVSEHARQENPHSASSIARSSCTPAIFDSRALLAFR